MVVILFDFDQDSPRIDKPYERNQEWSEDDHHCFILDNTKIMGIDVMIGNCFDQNSHNCSCKEHAK